VFLLQPYTKSYEVFRCPSNPDAFYPGDGHNAPVASGDANYANAPGAKGAFYGGQNSYGHNDAYMSPAGKFNDPTSGAPLTVANADIKRPASVILITDATYYGVCFDAANESGLTDTSKFSPSPVNWATAIPGGTGTGELGLHDSEGSQYRSYWKNIGNSKWSYNLGTTNAADALKNIPLRHQGLINCQFVDGHVKAIPYKKVIGDVCLWTTDIDGPHPACN
jgi:prepilin-type processing-associated H-X9-DG protein